MTDEQREAVARAICRADACEHTCDCTFWTEYRKQADAAIAAYLAAQQEPALDFNARLRAAYEKVSLWPENRMKPDAVLELGPGFNDLLALRNLVGEVLAAAQQEPACHGCISAESEVVVPCASLVAARAENAKLRAERDNWRDEARNKGRRLFELLNPSQRLAAAQQEPAREPWQCPYCQETFIIPPAAQQEPNT